MSARVATAPEAYLSVHDPADVARQCALLTPVPAPGEVRVVTAPRAVGQWHLDVGARDRVGLLACFTGVLAAFEVDVAQAVVATWPDGAALEAFVVRSADPPDVEALVPAFEASLAAPLSSVPLPDAAVVFDDSLSSAYTACEVRAGDRAGLLHAIAVAFAAAGVDVHGASVTTSAGFAVDRFDLTDRLGCKLSPSRQDAVRRLLADGVTPQRRRRRRLWGSSQECSDTS